MKGARLVAVSWLLLAGCGLVIASGCSDDDDEEDAPATQPVIGPLIVMHGGDSGSGTGGNGGLIQIVASDNIKFENPNVTINVPSTPSLGSPGTHITAGTSTSELVGQGLLMIDIPSDTIVPTVSGDVIIHAGVDIVNDLNKPIVISAGNLFVSGILRSQINSGIRDDLDIAVTATGGAIIVAGSITTHAEDPLGAVSGDLSVTTDNIYVLGAIDTSGGDSPGSVGGGIAGDLFIGAPTAQSRERVYAFLPGSIVNCSGGSSQQGQGVNGAELLMTTDPGPQSSLISVAGTLHARGGDGSTGSGAGGVVRIASNGLLFWAAAADLSGGSVSTGTGSNASQLIIGATGPLSTGTGSEPKTPFVRIAPGTSVSLNGGAGGLGGMGGNLQVLARNDITVNVGLVEGRGGTSTAQAGGTGGSVGIHSSDGQIDLSAATSIDVSGAAATVAQGGSGGAIVAKSDSDDPVARANFEPSGPFNDGKSIANRARLLARGGAGATGGDGGTIEISSDPLNTELQSLGSATNLSEINVSGGDATSGAGGDGGQVTLRGSDGLGIPAALAGFLNSGTLGFLGGLGTPVGNSGPFPLID